MLTVGLDDQIFRRQRAGGISRIFTELARQWGRPGSVVRLTPLFRVVRSDEAASVFPGVRSFDLADSRIGTLVFNGLNGMTARRRLSCDVIHHTYFDRRALDAAPIPRVCHIHDMIDEELAVRVPAWFDKRAFLDRCDAVICVSESTKRALLRWWPIDESKLNVVPLAASPLLSIPSAPPPQLQGPFILYVGSRASYKSFRVLLDALVGHIATKLVAVGGGAFTPVELAEIAGRGLSDRVRQTSPSDRQLAALYQYAAAVVQTSTAEGFGLPVLEAMAVGTPVIAADIDVVREVATDAARLFAPGDSYALSSVLDAVLHDPEESARLRERGLVRAADFSWERTAGATERVYEAAIERYHQRG